MAADQIAGDQIAERVPTHRAPKQDDRDDGHQSEEQHKAQESGPYGRTYHRGQNHEPGEYEDPFRSATAAPPSDAGTAAV
jgi:hypothetical protein